MAKYYSSTFGKISGKHGSAVAVIRKDGSTYLRLHVPASNPRTEKQQAHRAKFALTSKSLVPFNPIFKQTIGITNGISTARSYAFKNAIVGEYPNLSMDYEKLMFSFGALEKLHNASVSINEATMTVSWDYEKMYNSHGSDSVSFVIFNKDTNQSLHLKDIAVRSDKSTKIDIYDSWANCDLYLWAYVTKDDKISDSVFVPKRGAELNISTCVHLHDKVDGGSIGIGQGAYPEKGKRTISPIQSFINGVIINLIAILYNLLQLFKKSVITTNTKIVANTLINSNFILAKHIEYNDIERVPKLNLRTTWRAIIDVLYNKYRNTYPPVPVSVMRC